MMHRHLNEEDVQVAALRAGDLSDQGWTDCPECRERVEAYRLMFGTLAVLPPESPAFDLESAVMAQLPERVKPQAVKRRRVGLPVLIGSLAFLVVVIGVLRVTWGFLTGKDNWFMGIALVTVPGIAIWLMIDGIQDHRRKIRSIGIS